MRTDRLRLVVSALLVASATLFAVGVAIERHQTRHNHVRAGVVLVADADRGHEGGSGGEAGKQAGGQAEGTKTGAERGGEPARGESAAHRASERHGERVFGIDTESTALVIAAVVASLVLVAGLWLRRESVLVPLLVLGAALTAAVFDVREVVHQIDESRATLAVIAAVVAILHLAAAGGGGALARHQQRTARPIG